MCNKLIKPLVALGIILASIYLFPWHKLDWGTIRMGSGRSITVTGTAKQQQVNEIARFNASVSKESKHKSWAKDGVNENMEAVIKQVKEFGIDEKDIKTQSLSLTDNKNHPDENKRYRASNSIEIILREVDRASELANLLNHSKATGVYGPNLGVDDTEETTLSLVGMAIEAARKKAEAIAKASDGQVGKVLEVTEGERNQIMPRMDFMQVGGEEVSAMPPIETGSTLIQQSVTVTFELK